MSTITMKMHEYDYYEDARARVLLLWRCTSTSTITMKMHEYEYEYYDDARVRVRLL